MATPEHPIYAVASSRDARTSRRVRQLALFCWMMDVRSWGLALGTLLLASTVTAVVQKDSTCDGPVVTVEASTREGLQAAIEQASSVWRVQGNSATINLRPGQLSALKRIEGIANVTVTIPDLAALVGEQAARRRKNWTVADSVASRCSDAEKARASPKLCGAQNDPFFDEYREVELIYLYMEALALEHPDITTFVPSVGDSYEGRPIPALMIGGEDGGDAVFLQAELHAREWITPSTAMFIAVELLETDSPEWREIVRLLKFIIIPVANPDGYVHTWTDGGRQWRKSRSPNEGSECVGTDLNRNWDDGSWGGPGASADPCAGTYRGSAPFSEVETAQIAEFLSQFTGPEGKRNKAKHPAHLVGGIDYHSFGQVFLRPYAWASTTTNPPPNDDDVAAIGQAMADAAGATPDGVPYTSGGWHDDLYPSSGVCGDYLYNITSSNPDEIKDGIAFTAELRDLGQFGFVLPDSEIVPTGVEQVAALKEFVRGVLSQRRGKDWSSLAATKQH